MIFEYGKEVETPADNIIIGNLDADDGKIIFRGKGNILYLEDNVKLLNSKIIFNNDNALVYLSSATRDPYCVNIYAWKGTTVFIGKDNYFNSLFSVVTSERKSFILGNECIFAFGIWVRTADPHLLYSIESQTRLNNSKSIFIGDHVWIGQNALLLKGTNIGSGSVVAASSVLSNKNVESNSVYAGNPARLVRKDIFYTRESAHNYTAAQTQKSMKYQGKKDDFVYKAGEAIDMDLLDQALSSEPSAEKRLEILKKEIVSNTKKSRFYVGGKVEKKGLFGKIRG